MAEQKTGITSQRLDLDWSLVRELDKIGAALTKRRGTPIKRQALIREILTAAVRNPQAVGLDLKAA